MNALFTPIDMTDYENSFVSWNEMGTALPIANVSLLDPLVEDPLPQKDQLSSIEAIEKRPIIARSSIHRDMLETKALEAEADGDEDEEEEEEGEGEEGEGEEGEEGEGEGEGEEAEGEAGAEEEEEVYPPEDKYEEAEIEDKYFLHNETLRKKYNEVELDSFMKLLNVKPYRQWQDETVHHHKLGVRNYEDDSQQLDPHFHLHAEIERKYAERSMVEEFRRGAEVKFSISEKRPAHYNYRF